MKALIIGAAGFVGKHLIAHLKSLGWEVSATRLPQEEIKEDVPNFVLDILNQNSISSLLDNL
jgi:nucleoside-diphosphate-sugar epimerase